MSYVSIDLENQRYWDCDYLLQVAAKDPIVISKERGGIFYTHPASFSLKDLTLEEQTRVQLSMVKRIQNNPHIDTQVSEKLINLLNLHFLKALFMILLFSKKFDEASSVAKTLGLSPALRKESILYACIVKFAKIFPFSLHGLRLARLAWKLLKKMRAVNLRIS